MPDVWFPHLGIKISHLSSTAFSIFGLDVAWYGLIIALGVLAGLGLACLIAKKTGQKPEVYTDFIIYALIFSILGAHLLCRFLLGFLCRPSVGDPEHPRRRPRHLRRRDRRGGDGAHLLPCQEV